MIVLAVALLAWTSADYMLEVRVLETPNGQVTYLDDPDFDSSEKKIIGSNEMVKVNDDGSNLSREYQRIIDGFGKISMGCSATHVGNGIVISAGHCFKAQKKEQRNVSCRGITIQWGLIGNRKPYLNSRCEKILAMQLNNDTDYAILKVSPAPKVVIPVNFQRVSMNKEITIFGHPMGRPLEWSGTCTVAESKNSRHAGYYQFTHQCDTLPGNSGSTILDDRTLEVIGIHDGGIAPWNYGTYIVDTPIREFL
jgi:V8-like Glu-specific endopeptidase